ncbi:hypothetical protein F8M41_021342 [Gigaspora margarita]|uniref:Uncharacterized protein n=1 Tax=Gigaspora margarita TaxID=4874 RepID=A0A8H4B1N2_GIGMA|nr:hypothetical protein F8M41_021342 [Gigaspora margarita]
MILFRTYAILFIIIIILFYTQADNIPFLSYQQSNYSLLYDVKQFSDGKLILLTENDPGLHLVFSYNDYDCEINANCYNGMIIDLNGNIIVDNIQLGGITQITTDNTPSIGFLGTFLLNNTIKWIKFCIPNQNSNTNNQLQIANAIISARMNYSITEVILFNNIDGSHAIIVQGPVGTVFQYTLVNRGWYYTQMSLANYVEAYAVVPLPFGDILVYVNDYNTYGLVDPSKSNTYETLELKNISSSYYFKNLKNLGVFPNNTAWFFYNDSRNANWSLFVKDMPKINDVTFYENSIIKSASPNHNMSFQLPTQLNFSINITFTIPIVKSSRNLTIYQSTQIHQKFPINSKYCNISHDVQYKIAESTTATLRLIVDSNSIKLDKNFYDMLQQQLIDSIPLNDKDRLKQIKHINDPTSANKILMEFLITKANSTEYLDVSNIINVLDDLIQNKDTSALVQYNLTKFLDSSYGFKANPSLIEIFLEIKYELLGISILFIILFVGYLGLKKCNPKVNL